MQPSFKKIVRYDLGSVENPTTLMSHDWLMRKGHAPWNQPAVQKNALLNGPFEVNIVKAGKYRITPMRWPEYVDKPSGCKKAQAVLVYENEEYDLEWDADPTKPIGPSMIVELPAGEASLTSTLTREDGKQFGAYFVKVEYLGKE
jgi:hypothetical protein